MMKINITNKYPGNTLVTVEIDKFYRNIFLIMSFSFFLSRISVFLKNIYIIKEKIEEEKIVRENKTFMHGLLSSMIKFSTPLLLNMVYPSNDWKFFTDFYNNIIKDNFPDLEEIHINTVKNNTNAATKYNSDEKAHINTSLTDSLSDIEACKNPETDL